MLKGNREGTEIKSTWETVNRERRV